MIVKTTKKIRFNLIGIRSKQENEMKKYLLFMLVVLSLSVSLIGCNAVHGAGQDISDTGHNISHAAS